MGFRNAPASTHSVTLIVLIAQVATDDARKVKEVQMKLLRQGDERTDIRYGKSASPARPSGTYQ
ncbi:MAG TPA: hypothetical protein VK574_00320 [Terracidiphilus sp.]|nr:hypothetical protein [Terracidiphilus sp.]